MSCWCLLFPSSFAFPSSGPGWPSPESYTTPNAVANSGYGYTTEFDTGPMPRGDDSWNPFPRHPFTPDFKQNQRVVHTQVFKEIEVGEGPNKQKQLWVTEIDADGIERLRRPEFFFHGIVGHVKDKWGYHINGWREASRIANYWRRDFDIAEVPYAILIGLSRMSILRTMLKLLQKISMTMGMTPPKLNFRLKFQILTCRCPCKLANLPTSCTTYCWRILSSMPRSLKCYRFRLLIRQRATFAFSHQRNWLSLVAIWPSRPIPWPDEPTQRIALRITRMMTTKPFRD